MHTLLIAQVTAGGIQHFSDGHFREHAVGRNAGIWLCDQIRISLLIPIGKYVLSSKEDHR
jgi:hypothetical protein